MQKKLIIIVGCFLFLVFAGFFSLPMLVDKEAVKSQVIASFKLVTGLDLLIQGQPSVEVFPLPHLIIRDAYIPNNPTAAAPFLLTVKSIDIWPKFWSLFSRQLVIDQINVTNVDVELERLKEGGMNWRGGMQQALPGGTGEKSAAGLFNASSITISQAALTYTDSVANAVSEFSHINMTVGNSQGDGQSSLQLNLEYKGKPFEVAGRIGHIARIFTGDSLPAHVSVTSKNSHFLYDGEVGLGGANYTLKGSASVDTDDIVPWITLMSDAPDKAAAPNIQPLPLKVKTDIMTQGEAIVFNNLALDGPVIKGSIKASFVPPYKSTIEANIATLDLEAIFDSGLFAGTQKSAVSAPHGPGMSPDAPLDVPASKTLWNMLMLDADIKVADMIYNHQHIQNAHFNFDMEAGEVNIPQASAVLPGESRLVFIGIGRKGYQGLSLEGQIDAAGGNFAEMIKIFKLKGFAIPVQDFKRFRIKTNAVILAREARFSELVVRIENMGFIGGVVATFGDRTLVQTALRIGGVNLDHFMMLWGVKTWESSFLADNPGPANDEFLSHWIKQLGFDLQVNASIKDYILDNKLSSQTDFELSASPGKINVPKFKTYYNGSTLTGSVALDVTGAMPRVDMDVVADVFDTAQFLGRPESMHASAPRALPGEYWSHAGFDFHWLDLLNSNYNLKIGRFTDGSFEVTGLAMKGNINNRTLTVDALSGETLGAKFEGKTVLVGGRIPSLSLAGNIQDLDVTRIYPLLPALSGMVGKFNLSMRLQTTGIDTYTWMSNLNGIVAVAGRNIVVHGFNLMGIVKAVNYVRTVANILNVVKRAFPGGDTLFSSVQGNWTFTNGVAVTTDLRASNPDSEVLLACKADIVNWKVDGQVSFPLTSLDAHNPPNMILNLAGGLDAPEKTLDTRLLEQYVTNQTSEKMLREYGH